MVQIQLKLLLPLLILILLITGCMTKQNDSGRPQTESVSSSADTSIESETLEKESEEESKPVQPVDNNERDGHTGELPSLPDFKTMPITDLPFSPADLWLSETGWKMLKISGILDFGMIGVIAKISNLLAEANISIFVISTYNTDYILLKSLDFDEGVTLLENNGYTIVYAFVITTTITD